MLANPRTARTMFGLPPSVLQMSGPLSVRAREQEAHELSEQIIKLRQDAERYRAIFTHCKRAEITVHSLTLDCGMKWRDVTLHQQKGKDVWDAAIDEAMKADPLAEYSRLSQEIAEPWDQSP